MSIGVINIDNRSVVAFTNKLEKMQKHDLPVVINQTLNSAAFDVKKVTMPGMVKQTFTERNKSFFRSTSRVKKSTGFNINAMKSEVGFIGSGNKESAVRGLEAQENGGVIGGRSFIAADSARVSGSNTRKVKASNRLNRVRFIDARKSKGKTKKQRWIAAVVKSKETGIAVLGNHVGKGGGRTVSRIRGVKRVNGKLEVKRTVLYSYKKGRTVQVKSTQFMQRASHESGLKLEDFFIQNAKRRIKIK